jgi:hypothetical protein
MTPYATKKANGRKAAIVKLSSKLSIISGTRGPMIFVRKEMTKKMIRIKPTKRGFLIIRIIF